jgi:hypothetical protein
MRPVRAAVVEFAAIEKDTGLSPICGIDVVMVIHGASDCAVQRQAFCVAPPHVFGSLVWMTSKRPVPPATVKLNDVVLYAL